MINKKVAKFFAISVFSFAVGGTMLGLLQEPSIVAYANMVTTQSPSSEANQATKAPIVVGGQPEITGPAIYGNIETVVEQGLQPAPILGGASLTMLPSQTDNQILSMILQTSSGSLIVVDGGLGTDGDALANEIKLRGGRVAAWLVTHPQGDHVGALYSILQDGGKGITIDDIYYSLATPDWYTTNDPHGASMANSLIGTLQGLPVEMLNPVSKGQIIQVDDVTIEVLNSRYEIGEPKGNNASIVYKATVNQKSILFLGDLAEEGGERLLAEVGAEKLKSDIVQMAHHGQDGVGESVYQAIDPDICLWPTPGWLWSNTSGAFKTPETKVWMTKIGQQLHYVMKDGLQIIY